MFDADVVSQRVSPGLTNGETTLGCRRHELKFDPFATLFKASKPPGGPFKPSFGLSGAVLWPHTHFPRGRVARSFGDVCFPFRNCGCPALAFFARAGTVPPLTWDLLCPAVCAASMALISCGKAGPVRVNAGWTKIPFRDRVA